MADLKLLTAHFIYSNKIQYTPETLTQDCIDLVEYFDCKYIIKKACKEGLSLNNIKYLIKMYDFDYWNLGMSSAVEGGHSELVEFFVSKGADNLETGMIYAAEHGNKELVDFFVSKGADSWNFGMIYAALGGHRNLVDFFISKGANNWNLGMINAAEGGHRELVEFFKQKLNNSI